MVRSWAQVRVRARLRVRSRAKAKSRVLVKFDLNGLCQGGATEVEGGEFF